MTGRLDFIVFEKIEYIGENHALNNVRKKTRSP